MRFRNSVTKNRFSSEQNRLFPIDRSEIFQKIDTALCRGKCTELDQNARRGGILNQFVGTQEALQKYENC